MRSLSIVIPAYNEEHRLPRTLELIEKAIQEGVFLGVRLAEILIIDDGSRDRTAETVEALVKERSLFKIVRVFPNQGKGNAIHTGLKASSSDWCLIADADSATPWNQFLKLQAVCFNENHSTAASSQASIAIGSRDLPESDVTQKQSWIREHMGKTFNLLVRFITGLPFRDTQCGFKLIHRPSILQFLNLLKVKRFAWDVEFLMFAKKAGLLIREIPVQWEHQDESHVNPIKDSTEMLLRVLQLRIRLWLA